MNAHGMVMSLIDLDLCQKQGIIQCGGYLTDTTAILLYYTAILISTAQFITILGTEWNQMVAYGKALSGTDQMSVDQFSATFYVRISSISGTIISSVSTQNIGNRLQIFLTCTWFLYLHGQLHTGICRSGPLISYVIFQNLYRFIHIHYNSVLTRLHIDAAASVRFNGCLHRILIILFAFFHKCLYRFIIHRKFQLQILLLLSQILAVLISSDGIAGIADLNGFLCHIPVLPLQPEVYCGCFHALVINLHLNRRILHIRHLRLHCCLCLFISHAGHINAFNRNTLTDPVFCLHHLYFPHSTDADCNGCRRQDFSPKNHIYLPIFPRLP